MSNPTALVQKLWNYCKILRDDGLSYGDYVDQLTFLLFGSLALARLGFRPFAPQNPFRSPPGGSSLKMADEAFARGHQRLPFNKPSPIPKGKDWRRCWAWTTKTWQFFIAIRWRNSVSGRACSALFSARRRIKSRTRPSSAGLSWTAVLEAAMEQFATIAEDLKK